MIQAFVYNCQILQTEAFCTWQIKKLLLLRYQQNQYVESDFNQYVGIFMIYVKPLGSTVSLGPTEISSLKKIIIENFSVKGHFFQLMFFPDLINTFK